MAKAERACVATGESQRACFKNGTFQNLRNYVNNGLVPSPKPPSVKGRRARFKIIAFQIFRNYVNYGSRAMAL